MLKKTAVVLAAGTIAALGIGGTALAMDTPSPSASSPSTSGPATSGPAGSVAPADTATTTGTAISEAKAREIALAAVPGGTVEEIERETENKVEVWDVEVRAGTTEHEFEIDAATGAVLHQDAEQDDEDDEDDADDADDD